MDKLRKPAAVKRAKVRDRVSKSMLAKGLSHGPTGRSRVQVLSPANAFKHGFIGSFKLVAETFKAVKSVGGRFIRDDEDDPRPQARV